MPASCCLNLSGMPPESDPVTIPLRPRLYYLCLTLPASIVLCSAGLAKLVSTASTPPAWLLSITGEGARPLLLLIALLEIVLGIALLVRPLRAVAGVGVALLGCSFLAYALARMTALVPDELAGDCGCFGSGAVADALNLQVSPPLHAVLAAWITAAGLHRGSTLST